MGLKFDHIVHFMDRPEEGMKQLNELGIHAVEGGKHVKRGSYNTLSHFGLGYLELLGIEDFDLFQSSKASELEYSPFEEIARNGFRECFAKINLRADDLDVLAKKLADHGIQTNGPVPLSRRTPAGELLEWKLLYAGGHEGILPLPFFIDWGMSDEERYEQLQKNGTIATHEAGDLQIASIHFAVHNAEKTASLWQTLFDMEPQSSYIDHELGGKSYPLSLDGVDFIFIEKESNDGKIAQALVEKGEHPYLVTLTGGKEEKEFTLFGGHYHIKK